MQTIYEASILLVDDNPALLALVGDSLCTEGIILLVVALLLGVTVYTGLRYGTESDGVQRVGTLAEVLHPTADGLQWDTAQTPAEWMQGYAWADAADDALTIRITDNGQGCPPAVLAALQTGETGENTPHILGLHVVEQIAAAHGGTAAFAQALPHGATATLTLPI